MDYRLPEIDEWETAQPHAMWAEARGHCPVVSVEPQPWEDTGSFHVLGHADAAAVLRDWRTFSSTINGDFMGPFMGDLILALDGEEHRQYRNLVAPAFRRSNLGSVPEPPPGAHGSKSPALGPRSPGTVPARG